MTLEQAIAALRGGERGALEALVEYIDKSQLRLLGHPDALLWDEIWNEAERTLGLVNALGGPEERSLSRQPNLPRQRKDTRTQNE